MKKNPLNTTQVLQIFGNNVKQARLAKELSQEKLALDTGLDLTTINEIEKGHRSPKLMTVFKIARGLSITPSSLLRDL